MLFKIGAPNYFLESGLLLYTRMRELRVTECANSLIAPSLVCTSLRNVTLFLGWTRAIVVADVCIISRKVAVVLYKVIKTLAFYTDKSPKPTD